MNLSNTLIKDAIQLAHKSWRPILLKGLEAMSQADSRYLDELQKDTFFPTHGRIFAAFSQPISEIRYVLIGEGPYPRAESASGYCFMDNMVKEIWTDSGFSRPVNRATSFRNFLKMLLVAEGMLTPEETTGAAMAKVAQTATGNPSAYIQTLSDLQNSLLKHGFLLLNATLVFRFDTPLAKETKAWQPFLQTVLTALADKATTPPTLILWGKMAQKLLDVSPMWALPTCASEHPYNISFIKNKEMQALFGPLHLFRKAVS